MKVTFKNWVLTLALIFSFLSLSNVYGYRYVVYGGTEDMNGTHHININVMNYINNQVKQMNPPADFVISTGNLAWVQCDDAPNPFVNYITTYWKPAYSSILNIPLYTIPNYNDLCINATAPAAINISGQTYYQTQSFSTNPSNGPDNYKKLIYTFEHGSGDEKSLFIMMDSWILLTNGDIDLPGPAFKENGIDPEIANYINNVLSTSNAKHKFLIVSIPIMPLYSSLSETREKYLWRLIDQYNIDEVFAGYNALYSRWMIDNTVLDGLQHKIIQTVSGSAGAPLIYNAGDPLDSRNRYNVHNETPDKHVFHNYNYVVVDVDGSRVTQQAYKVTPDGSTFKTELIDKLSYVK